MKRIVLYFLFLIFLLLEITFVHSNPYEFNELNHGVKNNNILNPSDSNNQLRDDKQIIYSTELAPEVIEEEPVIYDLSAQVAKFIIYFIKKYCKNNDEVANLENLLETKGIGSIFRTNGAGKIQPNYGHLENNNKQKNYNNNNSPRMRIESTKPKPKANEIGQQQHNFDTAPNYKLQSPTTKPIQPDATKKSFRKEISPKQNQIKLTKQYQVPIPQNDYADVDYDYEYEIHDPTKINIQPPQMNQVKQKLYTIPRIQYVQVKPPQPPLPPLPPLPPPPPLLQPRDLMYDYEPAYDYASHPDEYGIRSNEYSLPEYDYQIIPEPPKNYYMEKKVPSQQPSFWDQLLTYIRPTPSTPSTPSKPNKPNTPNTPHTPKTTTEEPIAIATATTAPTTITESQRKFATTDGQEYPTFTERPMTQSTWPQTSSTYEVTTQEKQTPGFFDSFTKYLEHLEEEPKHTTMYESTTANPDLLAYLETLSPLPARIPYPTIWHKKPNEIMSPAKPTPRDYFETTTINRRMPETTTEHPEFRSSTTPDQEQTPSLLEELMAFFETNPPATTMQYKDDTTINRRVPETTTEQPAYSWTTPIYNIIKYFENSSEQPEQPEQPSTEYSWTQYAPEITTVLTEAPIRKHTVPSYDSYETPQESVLTDYKYPHYKNEHGSWPAHQHQNKKPKGHYDHQVPESNFEFSVWPTYTKQIKAQPNPEGGLRARPDFGSGYGFEVQQNFRPTPKAPINYADRIYVLYMNEIKNLDGMKPNYKLALSGPKYHDFVNNINKMKQVLVKWKNGRNFYDQPKIQDVTKQMTKLSGDNLKILGADSKEADDGGMNARRTFDGPEQIEEYFKDKNNVDDFLTIDKLLQKMITEYFDTIDKPVSPEQLYLYLFNIKDQMEKYKTLFKHLDWVDKELEKIPKTEMNVPQLARTWYGHMRKIYLDGQFKKPDFNIETDENSKLFLTVTNLPAEKSRVLIYTLIPTLKALSAIPDIKLYLGKQNDIDRTSYYEKLDEYAIPLKTLFNDEEKVSGVGNRRIFADTIEIKTEQEQETTTEQVIEITTQPALPVRNIEKHNNVFREFLMNSDE